MEAEIQTGETHVRNRQALYAKVWQKLSDLKHKDEPCYVVTISGTRVAQRGNGAIRHEIHIGKGPGFFDWDMAVDVARSMATSENELLQWSPMTTELGIRLWV